MREYLPQRDRDHHPPALPHRDRRRNERPPTRHPWIPHPTRSIQPPMRCLHALTPPGWSKCIEAVAMNWSAGFTRPPLPKNSPTRSRELGPFHVFRLTGEALDRTDSAFSKRPSVIVGAPVPLSARHTTPSIPAPACTPTRRRAGSTRCSLSRSTPRSKRSGADLTPHRRNLPQSQQDQDETDDAGRDQPRRPRRAVRDPAPLQDSTAVSSRSAANSVPVTGPPMQ